ncbi:probable amino acid permease 7 isoform X2 [Diospyros lotus]|uniref:probable amino acid permease 7 isoform X2 n=1 Tax=Diospyros lotus TaxID=55363 RepID=UPI002257999C|nr:probable amino acid permease 7 isoform X2 [Diospyros lotus]
MDGTGGGGGEEEEEEEDQQYSPLFRNFDESEEDPIKRTGTIWTAIAHVITGVIGAGVLSLAWSVAQLGWVAGPLTMLVFAGITILSSNLLCDCYRSPDPEFGPTRSRSYMEAVKFYLGEKSKRICVVFLNESLYGCGVAYVITAAASVRAIRRSNCYHKEGHEAPCHYGDTDYMLLFGAVQIILSQIPDFHNMAWLSILAAIMSFSYSFIGMGLGFAKILENGTVKGSIEGVSAESMVEKAWLVFQALGDVAFAYPYSLILLEIEDTLKSPPPENRTMKVASTTAIFITTFFYLCCGCFGYAAFGSDTPGNLLTGFGFYEPYWLVDLANACVVLHLFGGYQVFSQPVFQFVEAWISKKFPDSRFVNDVYALKLPFLPGFELSPLRLCFRTSYVVSTTVVAVIFPYFNQVLGVLGALNFWPLTIHFPVEMYFVQKKIGAWTRKWLLLKTVSFACLLVSILALVGSLEGLISAKLS